jgi:dipeptidyl-peptidase 4
MKKIKLFMITLLVGSVWGCATTEIPQEQTAEEIERPVVTEEDYDRATQMLSWNLSDKVVRHNVSPQWIDNTRFWYQVNTREGSEYVRVDAETGTRELAFDHDRLATVISNLSGQEYDANNLPLRSLQFTDDLETLRFSYRSDLVECDLNTYRCDVVGEETDRVSNSVVSPDGKRAVYIKEYDLWMRNLETGEDVRLTTEGEKYHGFGINNQGWNRSDRPIVKWSPDSKMISTFRLDERGVGKMTLWRTEEGRPTADIWPYALPGDEVVPMLERVVIDVENREKVWLDTEPAHQRTSNCCGLTRGFDWADNEWSKESDLLAFVNTSRDYKEVTLFIANPESGDVREVYHERDEIFFESNLTSRGVPNWRVLHDSDEFIWFTRKDNWGHLYLHDLSTGELKNRITGGDWNVVDILRVDEEERIPSGLLLWEHSTELIHTTSISTVSTLTGQR